MSKISIDFGTQNNSPIMSPIITEKFGNQQMGKLFLGSATGASNKQLIMNNEVEAVLTICSESNLRYPKDIIKAHKVIRVEDSDSENLSKYFDECTEFISANLNQGKNVLVHCVAGVSRSPAIVIAFLIKHFKFTYQRAFDFVKERRPVIQPNANFIKQLKSLDESTKLRQ